MGQTPAEQNQYGLVKLVSSVLLFTSGLVALSVLATNPQEKGASLSSMARAPASLVGMAFSDESSKIKLIEKAQLLEFGCEPPKTAQVGTQIRQIRLRGELCPTTGKTVTNTEIINLTNGFTATVFSPSPSHYSSDYIHLSEGQNRLRYKLNYTDGTSSEAEFNIVRN